jgi:lactoylglutathione lyase
VRYLHSMLRVGDLERSRRFFVDLLGFVEVDRRENPKGRYTLVYLAAPGDAARARSDDAPLVELTWNWDEQEYASARSFGHLAYRVDDIYATCQRLADAGVTINRPPRDGHMAFVRTPDGISIELLQDGAALPPREPWASAPNVGAW